MSSWISTMVMALRSFARRRRQLLATLAAVLVPAAITAVAVLALAPVFDGAGTVPIAVVNEDAGATDAEGRKVDAGADLIDSLEDDASITWVELDADEAGQGLADGRYTLVVKIPEDYSEKVASLRGDDPEQATVEIVSSGAGNVLATETGSQVMRQVQSRLRGELGEEYVLSVLNDVRGQASRLTLTADGSVMLDDAYDALAEGADSVATGLGEVATAADALGEGVSGIAQGVSAAGTGAAAIAQGIDAVGQGAEPLSAGASALSSGLDAASAGADAIAGQAATVAGTIRSLSERLSGAVGNLSGVALMGPQAGKLSQTLTEALDASDAAAGTLADAATGLADTFDGAQGSVQQLADGASKLAQTLSHEPAAGDETPAGVLQEFEGIDAETDAAIEELRQVALDDTLDAAARADAVAALDARLEDLAARRDELTTRLEDVSTTAETLASDTASSAQALAAGEDARSALADASEAYTAATGAVRTASSGVAELAGSMAGATSSVTDVALVSAALGGASVGGAVVPGVADAVEMLGQGVSTLGDQLGQTGAIGGGVAGIAQGASTLSGALGGLADATSQLAQGNIALGDALQAVGSGASGLGEGISAMSSVLGQFSSGVTQLKEGSSTITDAMASAGDALSGLTSSQADRAEVAARPVAFTSSTVDALGSGALAVAPAAAAAALWAGAVLIASVMDRRDARAAAAGRPLAQEFSTLALEVLAGLAQAVVVWVLLVAWASPAPSAAAALGGVVLVASASFVAFCAWLRAVAPRLAVPIGLAALFVQLVCAGAIVPASLAGPLSQAAAQVLPVSAVTAALRGLVAGSGAHVVGALAVCIVLLVLAVALVCVRGRSLRRVRPEVVFGR